MMAQLVLVKLYFNSLLVSRAYLSRELEEPRLTFSSQLSLEDCRGSRRPARELFARRIVKGDRRERHAATRPCDPCHCGDNDELRIG